MCHLARLLACLLLLACTPHAAAQTSYSASASAATAAAYPWIDISATGTGLTLADNAVSAAIAIGFTFNLADSSQTTLRVSSNGMVQFGATSTASANAALPLNGTASKPNIDAVLLPLWDDLAPGTNQIRHGLTGTAPNRVFVVSWLAVPFARGGATATFQVQLHEQGDIVYRYGAVGGNGAGATIGLELGNTDYVQYALNSAAATNGTTIVWRRRQPVATLSYLFNERVWNGTTGEVLDSSGSRHATAAGLAGKAGTRAATPAISGPTGTCGHGDFTRGDKDHVVLPATVGDLSGSSFTFTAWIRTTDASLPGQRVVSDDENLTGWALSLGDAGPGSLRFIGRSPGLLLDTPNVVASNTWYFVVLAVDAAAKQVNVLVYSAAGATLASVSGSYATGGIGSDAGVMAIGGNTNTARENSSSAAFSGQIDEVRFFGSRLVAADHHLVRQLVSVCPAYLVARYDFGEARYTGNAGELIDSAGYGGGPYSGQGQGSPLPVPSATSPARSGSPGTCAYALLAGPASGGPGFVTTGLPLDTAPGAQATVAFWMYWDGSDGAMPVGFQTYALWFRAGHFGFSTNASDVHGVASTGLANGWRHVVAVFTDGSVTGNRLWIDGVQQALSQRLGTPSPAAANLETSLRLGGYGAGMDFRFTGRIDQVRIYQGAATPAEVAALHGESPGTCAPPVHHLRIEHASGSGLTCTPATLTVLACADAGCTSLYIGGVTGALGSSGGSVVWPDGAAFDIAPGSGSTTLRMQSVTTAGAQLGGSASAPVPANATACNFGSPSCTFTAVDSGLLFDVPHHASETVQTVSVSAVKKADNSLACTPAFASVTRSVRFTCNHANPATGTLPVRVGGSALNAVGSAGAACDATGQTLGLAFDANGVASTAVQYADAGQMTLNARYDGSAATGDTGLVMTGSDSFIAAPDHFTIGGVGAGPIRAGASFSASVTARNASGQATPNFGRETATQQAGIGWVRLQPTGVGAVDGVFSGTAARSFIGGAVTASDLRWTEVGRGDLVVRLSSGSGYLGSGLEVFGSSAAGGARWCANESGSCALPGGTIATVYFGTPGGWAAKAGQSGNVACSSANFGDPPAGTGKRCYYAVTSATGGSVGDFIPHRFRVAATDACGAFTYAGQPAAATVTALNTAGGTTVNFNGSASTTPVFAQAVVLSDANALGLGTLSGAGIAAGGFSAGMATAYPSYSFTTKTTAPQSLVLRASNGAAGAALVSSAGGDEGVLALRSGRLRLRNAFGKAAAPLQVPAVTEYWSGNAWLLNSADSCTALAGASVALSNPRGATGAASAATTSAGALAISTGSGSITLAAPVPAGSSLSLDVSVNLGSTGTDQSCHAGHPATTGAGLPWLRAQNGSCAASADRDPAARASFGIYSPESRRTVHVRDIF